MRNFRRAFLMLLCCCASGCYTTRPVLMASLGAPSKTVAQLREHFGKTYTIVEAPSTGFLPARAIAGISPPEPVYVAGQCVTGHARVHYVVATDGSVASPYIEAASDGPFRALAPRIIAGWRYQAATVSGKPVASLTWTYLRFYCPIQLPAVAGLWGLKDPSVWIDLLPDGSALQCRVSPAGDLLVSKGHFEPPYWIVWDKYWGVFGVTYTDNLLTTTVPHGFDYQFSRAEVPMPPECVRAEPGG
jgi:hypothetical protein